MIQIADPQRVGSRKSILELSYPSDGIQYWICQMRLALVSSAKHVVGRRCCIVIIDHRNEYMRATDLEDSEVEQVLD